MMTASDIARQTIEVAGQRYRKFILHPDPVADGTVRCIRCGQIDEEPWHDGKLCPGAGGQLPQSDKVKRFIAANAMSPVVSGCAFESGGGEYRLKDGQRFRFTLFECRSMPQPRWEI